MKKEVKVIKLRAYHPEAGMSRPFMVTDRDINFYNKSVYKIYNLPENTIIMQYTGINDNQRNERYPTGQEVCEGDVIELIDWGWGGRFGRASIVWSKRLCGFWIEPQSNKLDDIYDFWHEIVPQSTIIGNLCENPELMEPA